jgi:hypothetical protein
LQPRRILRSIFYGSLPGFVERLFREPRRFGFGHPANRAVTAPSGGKAVWEFVVPASPNWKKLLPMGRSAHGNPIDQVRRRFDLRPNGPRHRTGIEGFRPVMNEMDGAENRLKT